MGVGTQKKLPFVQYKNYRHFLIPISFCLNEQLLNNCVLKYRPALPPTVGYPDEDYWSWYDPLLKP